MISLLLGGSTPSQLGEMAPWRGWPRKWLKQPHFAPPRPTPSGNLCMGISRVAEALRPCVRPENFWDFVYFILKLHRA